MPRLILLVLLFLLSLLTVFRAPTNWLWYVSILVTEFSWVFFCLVIVVLMWGFVDNRFVLTGSVFGVSALLLFALPFVDVYRIAGKLKTQFPHNSSAGLPASPFRFVQMISGTEISMSPFKRIHMTQPMR